MMCLIVVSNVLYKLAPKISIPLYQILLGCLIGISPYAMHLRLETEIFLILFIAPLLFMDGKHISNHELWKYKTSIISLALGLVFLTILIGGYFIHWVLPFVPFAACFALAAVLSPTDAVSVKAISNKVKMPHRVNTIVEGESLLNDASGLVAFKFAIAAQITGLFSIQSIVLSFVYVAAGGIIIGVATTYLIIFFSNRIHAVGVEDANVHTLIQVITPFAVFLIAEELDLSGILAVVACGIVVSLSRPIIITTQEANIRFVSEGAWSNLIFTLNGFVFLLLGMELPRIIQTRIIESGSGFLSDLVYVVIIYGVLLAIRCMWVYLFICKEKKSFRLKNSVIITLSGVRGAITLAACLSIPLTLDDGMAFPARDFILFISSGIILVSLLIANIILPAIAPKPANETNDAGEIATRKAIRAAIKLLKSEMNDENRQSAYALITHYKGRLLKASGDVGIKYSNSVKLRKQEVEIFKVGLSAEKEEIENLLNGDNFDKEALLKVRESVEFMENHLDGKFFFGSTLIRWHLFHNRKGTVSKDELVRVKMHTTDVAIRAIKQSRTAENREIARRAIEYHRLILDMYSKIYASEVTKKYEDEIKELEFRAKQAEKVKLQELLDLGEIDHATLSRLRLNIELEEVALLEIDIEDEGEEEDIEIGQENTTKSLEGSGGE